MSTNPTQPDQPRIVNLVDSTLYSIPFKDRGSHLEAVNFEFQSVRYIAIDSEVKVIPNFQNHFCEYKQKIS